MTKLRLTKEGQEMISKWQKEEIATLRAQNAELREALENAQITIHLLNHRENGKAFVGCKDCESVRAILTKYGDDNA